MMPMQLVEQHLIRRSDPRFAAIDQAAFASKNLYNQANYQIRQAFLHEGKYLPYVEIFHRLKHHEAYCALPRKVSNSILIQLHKNWVAFFKANEAYQEDPWVQRQGKRTQYPDLRYAGDLQACFKARNVRPFWTWH